MNNKNTGTEPPDESDLLRTQMDSGIAMSKAGEPASGSPYPVIATSWSATTPWHLQACAQPMRLPH